jgi:hypothetical protein|tara:strand:+ start:8557 stop:11055 length:2499 start_codon:yes stop_codon:yes gene_type:complete
MISDYCAGGMLLVEQEGGRSRRGIPGISPGEMVGIHFTVPIDGKDKHFRLEGKIVRVMEGSVGLNFPKGMDATVIEALGNYTAQTSGRPAQPKPGKVPETDTAAKGSGSVKASSKNLSLAKKSPFLTGGLPPAESKKIVAAIRKGVAKVLPEMTIAIFKYLDGELLEMAKDAKSNAEQSEYFAAMSNLEKAKNSVTQQFTNDVLDQIDNPRDLETLLEERRKADEERKQASAAKRVKLSLVNTEEFEDWLAVANIIARSGRSYEKYIQELLTRMGMMVDSWGHSEANPLGVDVVCHAFDDAIQTISLPKEIRQKVYTGYEIKAIPLFRKLYMAATKLLEDTGLFPDLDDDYISTTTSVPKASSEEEEKPEAVEEEETVEEEKAAEDEEEEELQDLQDELREELQYRRKQRVSKEPRGRRSAQSSRGRARQAEPESESAMSNIYSTVRDLLDPHNDLYEDDEFEEQDYVEPEEVQDLLQTLKHDLTGGSGQRIPIRQRILDTVLAGGRQRRLAPSSLERLDVVDNLVETIEEDSMLSGSAKNWIRQLELTLGKVASQQHDFLNDENPHRSLEVVNKLAALGGSESAGVQRKVEQIIGQINENYDSDPAVFDSALNELQPIIDRQSRAFTGNVQRAVKASEGQQTLVNAQRAVIDEIDQQFSEDLVPEVVMKLLPGWRNLLVNTHLRQGQDSADWKQHVRVFDQLMQQLDGSADTGRPDYIPPEELLEQIESGLDSISFEPGQRVPLVNNLRQMLTSEESRSALSMVDISDQSAAETLGFADVLNRDDDRNRIREERENDSSWQRQLDRALGLHVGEWVEFGQSGQESEIAIVA